MDFHKTEAAVPDEVLRARFDADGNMRNSPWYGAAEIAIQPLPALTVKAFYGAYKSGIRCSGGQCRILPGFQGARLSVIANF